MLRKTVVWGVLLSFSVFTLTGCASEQYQQNKGAAVGGGIGAVTGGVIGGAIGSSSGNTGTGIIVGSLLGGLAGAALGHYGYDQKRTETAAQQQYAYDYDKTKSNLVRIESASAEPGVVKPGGSLDLTMTYTVLGPQGATMEIIETREIRQEGQLTGKPQVTVQRQGGTYTSKVPLNLAADARPGTYTVTTSVQSGGSSDSKEFTFIVQ